MEPAKRSIKQNDPGQELKKLQKGQLKILEPKLPIGGMLQASDDQRNCFQRY